METGFHIRAANWQADSKALGLVRRRVFVDEQKVPEALEWDGLDDESYHVLATDTAGRPIGTGRIKANGHIGRMAVITPFRSQGVGSAILAALLNYARQQRYPAVYLHAQTTAIPFYEKYGFVVSSDEFMDAGIAHRSMRYAPDTF